MEVLTRPKLSALRRRQIRRNQGLSRNVKGFVFLCLMGMATFVFFFISVLGAVFVSLFSSSSSKTYQMEQWEVAEGFPKEAEAYLPIYQEAGKNTACLGKSWLPSTKLRPISAGI